MHFLKNSLFVVLMVLCFLSTDAYGWGQKKQPLTLVVVPARHSVLQIAFDLAAKYPVVLVSFQEDEEGELLLYAWNGEKWVYVTMADFEEVNFVQITPKRVVLVGPDEVPAIMDAISWCNKIYRWPTLNTAELLNEAGNFFHFRTSEWTWFSKRYNLQAKDLSDPQRKSWYKGSREEFLEKEMAIQAQQGEAVNAPAAETPSLMKKLFKKKVTKQDDIPPAQVIFETPIEIVPDGN